MREEWGGREGKGKSWRRRMKEAPGEEKRGKGRKENRRGKEKGRGKGRDGFLVSVSGLL